MQYKQCIIIHSGEIQSQITKLGCLKDGVKRPQIKGIVTTRHINLSGSFSRQANNIVESILVNVWCEMSKSLVRRDQTNHFFAQIKA